jgi:hypothetical protein
LIISCFILLIFIVSHAGFLFDSASITGKSETGKFTTGKFEQLYLISQSFSCTKVCLNPISAGFNQNGMCTL